MAKQSNSGLVLGALAVGGYLLYSKVIKPDIIVPAKIKAYTARVRVNIPAVRFKGDNIELDLYIQNPNSQPISIKAIVGDVYVTTREKQTFKVGNLDKYGDTVIKPAAETKMTLSVRMKVETLIPLFSQIVAGKVTGMTVTFQGTINVNGKALPVKESYKIS